MALTRLTFAFIFGMLRVRNYTVVPLQEASRRRAIARATGLDKTKLQASYAWWHGEADEAIRYWREVEQAEPSNPAWPNKIAQALRERGDAEEGIKTVRDAFDRGIVDEELELALLRFARLGRSNAPVADAEAIVADPGASPNKVYQAAIYLLGENRFEAARAGMRRIEDHPAFGWNAKCSLAVLDVVEERRAKGGADIPGWVSPARNSILVREPSSDTLVVGFALPSSALGVPLNGFHALLSSTGVNALYLYDSKQVFHLAGTDRFGPGWQTMLDGIKALAKELGVKRIVTVGGSATGYTAIRAALDLEAFGAIVFGTQTHMPENANFATARSAFTIQRLRAHVRPMMRNLYHLIRDAKHRPRIEIFFSPGVRLDRMHAANVAGLANVRLHAVEGSDRHDCLSEMVRRGRRNLLDVFEEA